MKGYPQSVCTRGIIISDKKVTALEYILNLLNISSYECGSNHEIKAVPPTDLEYASLLSDAAPSSYTLLVTVEMSRNDEMGPQQLSDIVRS